MCLQIEGLPTMVFVGMQPDKPALRVEGLHAAKVIVEVCTCRPAVRALQDAVSQRAAVQIFENEILAPASASQ